MNRTRITVAAVLLLVVAAGVWLWRRASAGDETVYRFATIERGDVEAAVSATGTLSAVTTVQVGTQVSGQVSAIYVDFNDRVKKGQLIARIDPTLQQQNVRDAQAGLSRVRAELEQAQREYDRNKQLYDRKVLTESEFNDAQYGLAVAKANVASAQVTLERARQNLAYTSIYAPIDGVVVERNVDVGQTVAASLSAPQLFLIANDLSRMQILASVDESDIGMIEEGQPARFTVQAYPNQTFEGRVKQVRLQSATTENVVSYTAVVEVENPDGRLLPGMTATVSFLTGSAENALAVPNAALRFRPTGEMLAQVGGAAGGAQGDSASARRSAGGTGGGAGARNASASRGGAAGADGAAGAGGARRAAVLWYVDGNGKLARTRVRTGLTDGQRTVVEGDGVREGMQVIVGVTQGGGAAASSGAASPFNTQQRQQGGPPRPGGF